MKEYQACLITLAILGLMLVAYHFMGAPHAGEYLWVAR